MSRSWPETHNSGTNYRRPIRLRNSRLLLGPLALLLLLAHEHASGGPMAIGGDDLTDHGSYGGGATQTGWRYIQIVLNQMLQPGVVTRPNDGSIAALGCSLSTSTGGDAGGAIHYAAEVALGKPVTYYEGKPAIDGFFAALTAGTAKPAVIWIAGTGALNDEDTAEVAAVNMHAEDLRLFLNSGGGVFSHGSGNYGWLSSVLPGVSEDTSSCDSTGAMLTPDGIAAYPGLSNSNFDATAGPCHSHLKGDFGTLKILAVDGLGEAFLLGGPSNTTIPTPGGFQITPTGACCGYSVSTLASGFESGGGIGPLGILPVLSGYVVSVAPGGKLLSFSGRAANQSRASATQLASYGDSNALGIALLGGTNTFMAQQGAGKVVEINPSSGAILRDVTSISPATGIVAFPTVSGHPRNGHLFVSQAGGSPNSIFDVNPSSGGSSIFNADGADGLCVTTDGSKLLAAEGTVLKIYDTVSGAPLMTSPAVCTVTDGIAVGEGELAGKAFTNCTNGEVWEWKYDAGAPDACPTSCPAGPIRRIASGGSRGDFIAVDRYVQAKPGGSYPSLLLTQTDRILRLGYSGSPVFPFDPDPRPADGGWFGPPDPRSGLIFCPVSTVFPRTVLFTDKRTLDWSCFEAVDVVRGDLRLLRGTGHFGGELCIKNDYVASQVQDASVTAVGNAYYYLIRNGSAHFASTTWSTNTSAENPGDPGKRDREITTCLP